MNYHNQVGITYAQPPASERCDANHCYRDADDDERSESAHDDVHCGQDQNRKRQHDAQQDAEHCAIYDFLTKPTRTTFNEWRSSQDFCFPIL